MTRFLLLRKAKTYFNDPPVSPPPPPAVPPTVPPPPPTPAPRTFTQADVDRMMAEHRQGLQKQNADMVKQLEELRDASNTTAAQKAELEARIANLQQQHLTDAQKKELEIETWKKKYDADTKAKDEEATKWRNTHHGMLITSGIVAGAAQHKAVSAQQLTLMLTPLAKVVEVTDEAGKGTGQYVAKLPVTVMDPKTKQPVRVELPIPEAIGEMSKQAEFGNLFLIDGKPGLGGKSGAGAGGGGGGGNEQPNFNQMTPQQYREWRAKQAK